MKVSLKRLSMVAGLVTYVALCSLGAGSCNPAVGGITTQTCLQCHNGRLAVDQSDFPQSAHDFLSCEDCHGSGFAHVRNGGRGGLFIVNPEELPFDAHYEVCQDCHGGQTDGYLLSEHAVERAVTCYDCHDPHEPNGALVLPAEDNSLCMDCHVFNFPTEEAVAAHTNHPVDPAGTGASRCIGCHMPALEHGGESPHDHTLQTVPPIVSALAAEAGQTVPPNSCAGTNGCHDGSASGEPVFDVNNPGLMRGLQALYESWFGDQQVN